MVKEEVIVNKRPQEKEYAGNIAREVLRDVREDTLSVQAITAMLATSYLGRRIIYKETTGSTNDDAKWLIGPAEQEGVPTGHAPESPAGTVARPVTGTVVIAEKQTGGKGRLGRRWESPAGGVFMSAILRPDISPDHAPLVAILAGYAVASAIRSLTGLQARLKWPNDVLVEGKKVCGILCEAVVVPVSPCGLTKEDDGDESTGHAIHPPYIICGIGINANQGEADFPEDIKKTASSIRMLRKRPVDRNALVAAVLNNLERALFRFEKTGLAGIRESLHGLWAFVGRQVVLQNRSSNDDSKTCGTYRGVDDGGRALIEVPGGETIAFSAGDLSLRPMA